MKYKLIQKVHPTQPDAPRKHYAIPVNAGKFTLRNLSEEIAARTSLSRGDIENVLTTLVETMPVMLKVGLSIKLGNFGTFRLNLASEGVDNADEFTTANIKGVKIIFTPSAEMKQSLKATPLEQA
ncbi:MAG: HU family DNA-binding protein [Prevotellaceae bacterium]|jgi:predicted histone-like DNA-binding protein|nr:HU family DNA-binding protein [Prevotellaceae bacterium]